MNTKKGANHKLGWFAFKDSYKISSLLFDGAATFLLLIFTRNQYIDNSNNSLNYSYYNTYYL